MTSFQIENAYELLRALGPLSAEEKAELLRCCDEWERTHTIEGGGYGRIVKVRKGCK